MIEVRLFATLRKKGDKISFFEADKFAFGQEVLDHFQIPKEDVAIFLINGRHSKPEDPIKDGDILAIFPPVGGG